MSGVSDGNVIRDAFGKPKPVPKKRKSKSPENPSADDPASWPVVPLGTCGKFFYFLDAIGQLQELKANDFSRLGLKALFGPKNHQLEKIWPRYGEKGAVNGPDNEVASGALIRECGLRGVWNPLGRVRGAGSWLGDAGALILHCGDAVLIGNDWQDPGMIGPHVYPAAAARFRPHDRSVAPGAIEPLHSVLKTWNWRRGEIDARLLLGWIGASLIAGAISWRPLVWITGGRGTGKSTIHKLLGMLLADSLVSVSDASAAGIWQKLGHSTLPVVIDEVESEEDNRRSQALIRLARLAASGGLVLRGGADHGASEFTARSCFLCSSILVPPLQPQDKSRMAILELGELGSTNTLSLDGRVMRSYGEKILRRLVDGWPRWTQTLEIYREALAQAGDNSRGADVFGTLLAAADLLLNDGLPTPEFLSTIISEISVGSRSEAEDDARDEERCLAHLATQSIPTDGVGIRRPVSEWIARAAGLLPTDHDDEGCATPATRKDAKQILGRFGLKVVTEGQSDFIAVANTHAQLAKLFAGTVWAGRAGSDGGWRQSLRRIHGAEASNKSQWFAGMIAKCTLVPLAELLSDPGPEDRSTITCQSRLGRW